MSPLPGYMSIAEVARLKNCNPMTVRRAIKAGRFPGAYRTNPDNPMRSEWYIPEAEAAEWEPAATKPGKRAKDE